MIIFRCIISTFLTISVFGIICSCNPTYKNVVTQLKTEESIEKKKKAEYAKLNKELKQHSDKRIAIKGSVNHGINSYEWSIENIPNQAKKRDIKKKQWYLDAIKLPQAWRYFTDNPTSKIGTNCFRELPQTKVAIAEDWKFFLHPSFKKNYLGDAYSFNAIDYFINKTDDITPCSNETTSDCWPDRDCIISDENCRKIFIDKPSYQKELSHSKTGDFYQFLEKNFKIDNDLPLLGKVKIQNEPKIAEEEIPYIVNLKKIDKDRSVFSDEKLRASKKSGDFTNKKFRKDTPESAGINCVLLDHPTNVTGLLASNCEDYGFKGANPITEVIPFRVIYADDDSEEIPYSPNSESFVRAVLYLYSEVEPDVINISRLLPLYNTGLDFKRTKTFLVDSLNSILQDPSFNKKDKNGQPIDPILVISAGNDTNTKQSIDGSLISGYPFIPVGAVDNNLFEADYSYNGNDLFVYAPGGTKVYDKINDGILTTSLHDSDYLLDYTAPLTGVIGGFDEKYGTSFSAPIVSGVISLMKTANPYLKYDEIYTILRSTSLKGTIKSNPDAGIINAEKAIKQSLYYLIDRYWRQYWEGVKKRIIFRVGERWETGETISDEIVYNTAKGFRKFYDNNSLVVRGSIKKVGDKYYVKHKIYLGQNRNQASSFDNIKKRLQNYYNNVSSKSNIKVVISGPYSIEDFYKSDRKVRKLYSDIFVDTNLDIEQLSYKEINAKKIRLEFEQKFVGERNGVLLYEDFGKKSLTMEQTRSGWYVIDEIWYAKL